MEILTKYTAIIEAEITKKLPQNDAHELFAPLKYILSNGGKRIRPALCLWACELYNGKIDKALDSALAIEYFHNFSLLHDDIMDEAPLRRGKPTVHHRWNENQAILSGDALLVLSYQLLENAPDKNFKIIYQLFNQTALEVCIGQQLDMEFETRQSVTEDEYLEMIRLKTSVLLAAALKIGSLCGNASLEESDKMYQYGINLGMAFQLRDDYLDVFGNAENFGKQTGGDILADKKTYLMIKTLEKASTEQQETLKRFANNTDISPEEKIEVTKNIMTDLNIETLVDERTDYYFKRAIEAVKTMTISDLNKNILIDFAEQLMNRSV